MPNIWYRICIGFKYLIDHTLINIMLNIQYVHTALEGKLPYSRQVLWGLIGDLSGAESIFAWWFIFIGYLRVFNCQWGCGAVVHVNYGKADFAFFSVVIVAPLVLELWSVLDVAVCIVAQCFCGSIDWKDASKQASQIMHNPIFLFNAISVHCICVHCDQLFCTLLIIWYVFCNGKWWFC